jgi:hypothetical protein
MRAALRGREEGEVTVRALGLRAGLRAVACAAGLSGLMAAPAGAASLLEKNFYLGGPRYDSMLPACDEPRALRTIANRFATKEGRFWNSALQIVEFDRIKETAYHPWADASIPRRFCSGRALVSDGIWRELHYSIIEDGGMIGWKWGVEWCVVGVDRNWAYNPQCRMARP